MTKKEEQHDMDNSDIVKMIIAMQDKSNKKNSITINPIVAVIGLVGLIVILVQVILGVGMWSIKDKLTRYDAYENRLNSVESTLVKFENAIDDLGDLTKEFKAFTAEPRFSEKDFNERISDKLSPIKDQLDRIEQKVIDKSESLETDVNRKMYGLQNDIDRQGELIITNDTSIRKLETELEIYKRTQSQK